jgi:hypothetical protein
VTGADEQEPSDLPGFCRALPVGRAAPELGILLASDPAYLAEPSS